MENLEPEIVEEVEEQTEDTLDDAAQEEQIPDDAEQEDAAESDDDVSEPEQKDEDSDSIVISIDGDDDEEGDANESSTMKHMRKKLKEQQRARIAAERKLQEAEQAKAANSAAEELGPKPEQKDFDFDPEKYEEALFEYFKKKDVIEKQQAEAREKQEAAVKSVKEKFEHYATQKETADLPDFDLVEDTVKSVLPQAHQEAVIYAAKEPEKVIYALGKKPELAQKIAKIDTATPFGLLDLGREIGKIEGSIKMTSTRKPKVTPERKVGGSSASAQSLDKQIEKARAEAAKTGNRTEVAKLLRQKRNT